MKTFARILHGLMSTSLILLAVSASPSAGWSQEQCTVQKLLDDWASALATGAPDRVVSTYDLERGVLLPTCKNGPLVGKKDIEGYFTKFVELKPEATFETRAIVGDCASGFASGLYSFKVKGGQVLRARYTYVFTRGLIAQHHSSLEPKPPLPQGCPLH